MDMTVSSTSIEQKSKAYEHLKAKDEAFTIGLKNLSTDILMKDQGVMVSLGLARETTAPLSADGCTAISGAIVTLQTELNGLADELEAWHTKLDELELDDPHLAVLHGIVTTVDTDRIQVLTNLTDDLAEAKTLTQATPPALQKLPKRQTSLWDTITGYFVC